MHTLTNPNPHEALVDADTLTCPGCHETITAEPPILSKLGPQSGAEFSHRDGSELCTDDRGPGVRPDRGPAMTSIDTRARPGTGEAPAALHAFVIARQSRHRWGRGAAVTISRTQGVQRSTKTAVQLISDMAAAGPSAID